MIGLGGVGLAVAAGRGAPRARATSSPSTSPTTNSQLAKALGATHTFNAGESDSSEQMQAATRGGVEFAFELAGSVRALELAYKITRRGGTTVTAGLPPPTATLPLPAVNLVAEERTIKGSYIGTCVPSRDMPRYIELYRQGRLPVDQLMSGRLKLEDINLGFDLLQKARRCARWWSSLSEGPRRPVLRNANLPRDLPVALPIGLLLGDARIVHRRLHIAAGYRPRAM